MKSISLISKKIKEEKNESYLKNDLLIVKVESDKLISLNNNKNNKRQPKLLSHR